jgi:hypothetical protein
MDGRILLTFDKDYGEFAREAPLLPAGIVLIRLPTRERGRIAVSSQP